MWRSFFFAVGTTLIVVGLQCLVVEKFYVDKNSKVFEVAKKASAAIKAEDQNSLQSLNSQYIPQTNSPGFSLPSSESYYGGPSIFHTPGYSQPSNFGAPVGFTPAANNRSQVSNGSVASATRSDSKLLQAYVVKDWIPWGLLAVGTIVILYTKSTGYSHSRYSAD